MHQFIKNISPQEGMLLFLILEINYYHVGFVITCKKHTHDKEIPIRTSFRRGPLTASTHSSDEDERKQLEK